MWLAMSRGRRTRAPCDCWRICSGGNLLRQQAPQVHSRSGGLIVASDDKGDGQTPRAVVVRDGRGPQAGVDRQATPRVVVAMGVHVLTSTLMCRSRVVRGLALVGSRCRTHGCADVYGTRKNAMSWPRTAGRRAPTRHEGEVRREAGVLAGGAFPEQHPGVGLRHEVIGV